MKKGGFYEYSSVKFKGIENIYTRSKQEIKQTVKANNKDTIEISDLGMYLNKVNSSEDKDRLEKIAEIKSKIENNTYRIDSNELAKKIIERTKGEI